MWVPILINLENKNVMIKIGKIPQNIYKLVRSRVVGRASLSTLEDSTIDHTLVWHLRLCQFNEKSYKGVP